ncbi:MAG: glycosyltransferase family 4 protein [Gemmatimonadetes bacterium]|nr:glycosyltransferase family 4 protein [Gemmatimonadota bacterium]
MKIVVVNWQDREHPMAGGAEVHLHEIFGRLARRGHEVTLFCGGWAGCPPRVELDGMRVIRAGTRGSWPFVARGTWRRDVARLAPDVLVEDINKVPLFTPSWGARRVVGLVPHLFGGTAFQELAAPMAAAVWLAERPIPWVYRDCPFQAISQSTADDLVARGIARERIAVILPGIDARDLTPDPTARSATPVIAYLGRLKAYKRVDLVIRAFAQLGDASARLEIAGGGDHRPALEALVRSLDLTERVRFLGFVSQDEKRALLRRAWVVALASPKEGWGITNLEAAACGTPVVASNSPGIRESVQDGVTGLLTPHGDVAAMAGALARFTRDAALVARMGAAARAFAEGFTWDRAALETERHLEAVA